VLNALKTPRVSKLLVGTVPLAISKKLNRHKSVLWDEILIRNEILRKGAFFINIT
jgi:hypothetical protein